MCDICLRSPCHPRCPNAPEPPVVTSCIHCGEHIHEGEDYYNIDGEPWCENCIDDCRTVAEADEPDYFED